MLQETPENPCAQYLNFTEGIVAHFWNSANCPPRGTVFARFFLVVTHLANRLVSRVWVCCSVRG